MKAVLIAPKEPLGISRVCHDPDCMQRIYEIGRKAGEESARPLEAAISKIAIPA